MVSWGKLRVGSRQTLTPTGQLNGRAVDRLILNHDDRSNDISEPNIHTDVTN